MADGSSARDAARQLAAAAGTRNASNYLSREVEDDYDEVNVSFMISTITTSSAGFFNITWEVRRGAILRDIEFFP